MIIPPDESLAPSGKASAARPPLRPAFRLEPRSVIAGVALGAVLGAGASMALRHLGGGPSSHSVQSAFVVEGSGVRIRTDLHDALRFDVVPIREAQPLQRTPVTARVAAVETRTAPSFAPLEGRIERVSVTLGDTVQKGTRLVLVRSGDLAGMLRELRASQAAAQTKRALMQRMNILVDSRAAAENELLVAKNDLKEAELQAKAADSRLKSLSVAEEEDNLYWVLSTQKGTVVQLDAVAGQHVGPNKEHAVATVADLDEVLVLADVAQQDVGDLSVGAEAQIHIPGSSSAPLSGKVETVSQVVDPDRQTVPIRVRIANPEHRLRPNAFVEAVFVPNQNPQRHVLQIPTESVVSDGLDAVVFVMEGSGVFKRRKVTVGRQADGWTEVGSGLSAGERVVRRGAILLLNALDL